MHEDPTLINREYEELWASMTASGTIADTEYTALAVIKEVVELTGWTKVMDKGAFRQMYDVTSGDGTIGRFGLLTELDEEGRPTTYPAWRRIFSVELEPGSSLRQALPDLSQMVSTTMDVDTPVRPDELLFVIDPDTLDTPDTGDRQDLMVFVPFYNLANFKRRFIDKTLLPLESVVLT